MKIIDKEINKFKLCFCFGENRSVNLSPGGGMNIVTGDPHIRTFGGQYFICYRLLDYTLVESKSEIIRQWKLLEALQGKYKKIQEFK